MPITQALKADADFYKQVLFGGALIRNIAIFFLVTAVLGSLVAERSFAFTANKVFFEFWPNKGFYRVRVNYTIPELKEAREARVEFTSKRQAEKYYFALLRGADFYMEDPKTIRFTQQEAAPQPW